MTKTANRSVEWMTGRGDKVVLTIRSERGTRNHGAISVAMTTMSATIGAEKINELHIADATGTPIAHLPMALRARGTWIGIATQELADEITAAIADATTEAEADNADYDAVLANRRDAEQYYAERAKVEQAMSY